MCSTRLKWLLVSLVGPTVVEFWQWSRTADREMIFETTCNLSKDPIIFLFSRCLLSQSRRCPCSTKIASSVVQVQHVSNLSFLLLFKLLLPGLKVQQSRNIYLSLSEYLSTTMLPWTTPSPYKIKLITLYGPMTCLKFQFGPMTQYSGVVRETG